MAVASRAQRAVTDVPPERWAQLGKALQEWREDVLGYQVRGKFADDRYINLRLVQDLEKNYRPGTYTKWALQDAAQAYQVPYDRQLPGSILAFLHGEADTLAPAKAGPAEEPAPIDPRALPPSPFDPDRTEADRPYVLGIWDRYLDLPRRVAEPSGEQMFPGSPDDARAWDSITAAYGIPAEDLVWVIADLRRRAAGRAGTPAANSHGA
jgi:hypothetical protein